MFFVLCCSSNNFLNPFTLIVQIGVFSYFLQKKLKSDLEAAIKIPLKTHTMFIKKHN
jgi:hypothetical protein